VLGLAVLLWATGTWGTALLVRWYRNRVLCVDSVRSVEKLGEIADWLTYDILQAPHHCSWRSLSFDSWSDLGEKVKVDQDARAALSQIRKGAVIVASSKPIKKDDDNPPHERAKREYVDTLDGDDERFYCTDEYWNDEHRALEFELTRTLAKAAALAADVPARLLRRCRGPGIKLC
jgi:hypothetical protein